ncbi:hypothetical protein KY289_028442 [Solanum tuberosum]|nr:hypothetical protein KY289_028442 [Solanum tuberosum]
MSIRIWFLIQQFVMRQNFPEYNHIPFVHYLHCRSCTTRVAIIQDYFPNLEILARVPAGLFTTVSNMAIRMGQNLPEYNHIPSVHYFYCCGCGAHVAIIYYIPALRIIAQVYICRFRVEVEENEPQHGVIHGMNLTVAVTYCVQCGNLLMWKINLPEYNHIPFVHYLHCRRCRTRVATIQDYFPALQILGSVPAGFFTTVFSVEVAEDERYHRGIDDMTLAETYCVQCSNKQNVDQDGDANEQDLGTNEENANQDENGGINGQVLNQDVDIVEGMGNIDLNANI